MDNWKLILGSKSPRRQTLIKALGFEVEIRTKEVEEIYPPEMSAYDVPEHLARLKAEPLITSLGDNELLITSDTIVVLKNKILGKPADRNDAIHMLKQISGNTHEVITGVCITGQRITHSFSSITKVSFSEITDHEIEYYIDTCKPFDKAGSYGIQEWIGYIGISKIEGCYYNVMGLPLHDLYKALKQNF